MSWSFPAFRIFGILVRIHLFLLIYLAGMLLLGVSQGGAQGLGYAAAGMGILFFSVLFHELSHCWMAVRVGAGAHEILLWPLGGLAYIGHTGSSRDEIKVSGVGPLSNFFLAAVFLGVFLLSGVEWKWDYLNLFDWSGFPWLGWRYFLLIAIRINLILGLFNLLVPAYPLDGGRILFAFLTIRYGRSHAARTTARIALVVGVAMGIWGIAQEMFMLLIIGVFVLVEAFQLLRLAKEGMLDAHPAFGSAPEYDYMPDRPQPERKPGFFARWRAKRTRKRAQRDAEEARVISERVDAVLEKVSREGIGSLSPEEKQILDKASKLRRGEE